MVEHLQIDLLRYFVLTVLCTATKREEIKGPQGGSVVLECRPDLNTDIVEESTLKKVFWYRDINTRSQDYVSLWTHDGLHEENVQWLGRTDINYNNGDLTIDQLILDDAGSYTCMYDTLIRGPAVPVYQGSSLVLVITPGRHTWQNVAKF